MELNKIELSDKLIENCYKYMPVMKLILVMENAILYHDLDKDVLKLKEDKLLKTNENLTDYQHGEHSVTRNYMNDRIFPLETVRIQTFNMDYDTKIEYVSAHTGQYANELAIALNARAVTIGNDIYFKDGEYKPESEQGKELLAHEFTHISQYEENRITPNTTKEELEQEAEFAEKRENADYDPMITVELYGRDFRIRKSEIPEVIDIAVKRTLRWFEKQKMILSENDYGKLMNAYSDWEKGVR